MVPVGLAIISSPLESLWKQGGIQSGWILFFPLKCHTVTGHGSTTRRNATALPQPNSWIVLDVSLRKFTNSLHSWYPQPQNRRNYIRAVAIRDFCSDSKSKLFGSLVGWSLCLGLVWFGLGLFGFVCSLHPKNPKGWLVGWLVRWFTCLSSKATALFFTFQVVPFQQGFWSQHGPCNIRPEANMVPVRWAPSQIFFIFHLDPWGFMIQNLTI